MNVDGFCFSHGSIIISQSVSLSIVLFQLDFELLVVVTFAYSSNKQTTTTTMKNQKRTFALTVVAVVVVLLSGLCTASAAASEEQLQTKYAMGSEKWIMNQIVEHHADWESSGARSSLFPVTGLWENELGSLMFLYAGTDGKISGFYKTGEGIDPSENQFFPLAGTHSFTQGGTTLGFTVSWNTDDYLSTTAWSGQYLVSPSYSRPEQTQDLAIGHQDYIYTTWTLVTATPWNSTWESTTIGQDEFHRFQAPPPPPAAAGTV